MPKQSKSFLSSFARGATSPTGTSSIHEPPMKISQAAVYLGCSAVTVRRRVADGSVPHLRIKGRLYFKKCELHAFLEAHRGNLGG